MNNNLNNNMNNNMNNNLNNNMNNNLNNNLNNNFNNMNNNLNNNNRYNNMNYNNMKNVNMNYNNMSHMNYGYMNYGNMNYSNMNYVNMNYVNMNNGNMNINQNYTNSNQNALLNKNMTPQLNNYISINAQGQMKNNNNNMINNKDGNLNNNINNNSNNSYFYQNKVGLQNLGQTCYMNSTLQCLSNIYELAEHLIKRYGTFNIDTQPLTVSFSSLLSELYTTKKQYIVPSLFKEIIGILNPLFKGNHAADSKDLLFFLIEKLHLELNTKKTNQTENTPIDFAQQEENSKDENKMLKSFINDFNLTNQSIISETFYGITRSTMKCLHCNIMKYSFQTFNLLIFQLKKIKEQAKPNNTNILTLLDAFNVEQKEEKLEGDNMIYCNGCKGLRVGINQQTIYQFPSVLIIILNRGKDNKDFNEEFYFPLELDFTKLNLVIKKEPFIKFYLCGVITHLGESGASGHFIAYCRNSPYSNFILYNDAIITPVETKDVLKTKDATNVKIITIYFMILLIRIFNVLLMILIPKIMSYIYQVI